MSRSRPQLFPTHAAATVGGWPLGRVVSVVRGPGRRSRRLPPGAVYIGRAVHRAGLQASPLANPFRLPANLAEPDDPAARRVVLAAYRAWLAAADQPGSHVHAELDRVRGMDLACWCAPRLCHGDVIHAHLLRTSHADPLLGPVAAQLAALHARIGPDEAARLGIVGTQLLGPAHNRQLVRLLVLDELLRLTPTVVISGGANGVDQVAADVARQLSIGVVEHLPVPTPNPPPGMSRFRAAGFEARNQLIAADCTALERLWWQQTRTFGSGWTVNAAAQLGKPTGQVRF